MTLYFLSDLHIADGEDPNALRLAQFLEKKPVSGDTVILGGDIFDLFVGNKAIFRARFKIALDAMAAAAARGCRVIYLEGNHDFHFASIFKGQANFEIKKRDFQVEAHGRRIWISHGDEIDRTDHGYLFLRAVTKNFAFKAFVGALPGAAIDFIGGHSSGASRKYTSNKAETKGTERIRKLYLEFAKSKVRMGFQHVLIGHSHLRDHIPIVDGGHKGEYINLGISGHSLPYAELGPGNSTFLLRDWQ